MKGCTPFIIKELSAVQGSTWRQEVHCPEAREWDRAAGRAKRERCRAAHEHSGVV